MKPDLLTKIDQVQAAKLDMTVVAVAESSVIDACYTWMKAQDGWDKLEVKSYLSYNGVVVQPATNPLGNPGWVVQLRTKS
jgi:hypothetical protein